MPAAGTVCRFAWPMTFDVSNNAIRASVNGVAGTVNIAAGTYWWLLDGGAYDLAKFLDLALQAHPQAPAIAISLSAAGRLGILSSKTITIHWGDALTTADPAWFGFTAADYAGGAPSYTITSPNQVMNIWNPERIYSDDSGLYPEHIISRAVDLSGQPTTYRWGRKVCRDILIDIVPATKLFSAEAGVNEAFDLFYDYVSTGAKFVWTPDVAVPATYSTWFIRDTSWIERWPVTQMAELSRYYNIKLPLQLTTFGA